MAWDPRKDAWLAGFTAGEGCFQILHNNRRRVTSASLIPQFQIALRADDGQVLEALQKFFGGSVSYRARAQNIVSCPMCAWHVASKRDLARLVQYFDRFPLQAKKARDYAIWRQAVGIYCAHGGRDARLAALRETLVLGRAFDAPEMDEPDLNDPFEVQLALGLDEAA